MTFRKTLASTLLALGLLALQTQAQAMTLEETIRDAIIHNPEFRAEVKRYNSYKAELRGGKSGYYPSVDYWAALVTKRWTTPRLTIWAATV